MKVLLSLILILASTPSFAQSECQVTAQPNTVCVIRISDLRPTQFSVGMISVEKKAKKLQKKDSSDYQTYMRKHPVPVVIGNGGQFYMVDHHHLARAVTLLNKTTVYAQIVQNWNAVSTSDFWPKMITNHYVYLFEKDEPRTTSELPVSVLQLKDDPYRSLSGEVEDEGGFIKGKVYFIEFVWAKFFRPRISETLIRTQFDVAVDQAVDLAHSRAASGMPGYSPVPVESDN